MGVAAPWAVLAALALAGGNSMMFLLAFVFVFIIFNHSVIGNTGGRARARPC